MNSTTLQALNVQKVEVLNLADLRRRCWGKGEILFSKRVLKSQEGPANDPRRPENVIHVLTLTAARADPITDNFRDMLSQELEAWAVQASEYYQMSGPFTPEPLVHEDKETRVHLINLVAYIMDGPNGHGHGV